MVSERVSERPWQLVEVDPWPDHVREVAYQVWWMRAGENYKVCWELLKAGGYSDDPESPGEPMDVPYSTLTWWGRQGNWHERAIRDKRALSPGLEHRTLVASKFGFAAGVEWLRAVAEGRAVVKHDRDRLMAVRILGEVEGYIGPDRIHAGHRAGLSANDAPAVDVSSLSDADLLALERGTLPPAPPPLDKPTP